MHLFLDTDCGRVTVEATHATIDTGVHRVWIHATDEVGRTLAFGKFGSITGHGKTLGKAIFSPQTKLLTYALLTDTIKRSVVLDDLVIDKFEKWRVLNLETLSIADGREAGSHARLSPLARRVRNHLLKEYETCELVVHARHPPLSPASVHREIVDAIFRTTRDSPEVELVDLSEED